jgi:hypothetical protein
VAAQRREAQGPWRERQRAGKAEQQWRERVDACKGAQAAPDGARGYALAYAGHDTRRIQDWVRTPIDPAHDALHAIERGAVQELLEVGGLSSRGREQLGESAGPHPPHSLGEF